MAHKRKLHPNRLLHDASEPLQLELWFDAVPPGFSSRRQAQRRGVCRNCWTAGSDPRFGAFCSQDCCRNHSRQLTGRQASCRHCQSTPHSPDCLTSMIEEHGLSCCICRDPIDPTLDPADSRAVSLDHLLPAYFGGMRTAANLRPAHRICNSDRSNRMPPLAYLLAHPEILPGDLARMPAVRLLPDEKSLLDGLLGRRDPIESGLLSRLFDRLLRASAIPA